jgi:hypothetical protein
VPIPIDTLDAVKEVVLIKRAFGNGQPWPLLRTKRGDVSAPIYPFDLYPFDKGTLDSYSNLPWDPVVFDNSVNRSSQRRPQIRGTVSPSLASFNPFASLPQGFGLTRVPWSEWKKVHVFPSILQVVAGASSRVFVGTGQPVPLIRVHRYSVPELGSQPKTARL